MALPQHVQAELVEQRREWWANVRLIATGVFIALVAFTILCGLVVKAWVDINFD